MQSKKNPKKLIVETLKKHPEGLTLQKVSNLTNMSRLTATKYVHELIGEGKLYQRNVGMAKLCYLKERFVQLVKQEEVIDKLKKRF